MTITQTTFASNGGDPGGGLWAGCLRPPGEREPCGTTATITDSTFVDNFGGFGGGGLANGGVLTITNSTVARNRSFDGGGGLNNSGTAHILNSTFAENRINHSGAGGILSDSGTVALQNTILARNTSPLFRPPDCAGPVTSLGHNLIGDPTGCTITLLPTDLTGDPGLGEFTDDGSRGTGISRCKLVARPLMRAMTRRVPSGISWARSRSAPATSGRLSSRGRP
jgi:hypothetical protein